MVEIFGDSSANTAILHRGRDSPCVNVVRITPHQIYIEGKVT